MKKIIQPNIRKVYGQQEIQQINTAKKINSLLSSGAVSVTGPNQQRILKQSIQPTTTTTIRGPSHAITQIVQHSKHDCYVCDEPTHPNNAVQLTEATTTISSTKIPNKIGRVVGDAFMVIISVDDIVCKRCLAMFNQMDRLESDLERVKTNILNLINKKYGITDGEKPNATTTTTITASVPQPSKFQRLNTISNAGSGVTATLQQTNRKASNGEDEEITLTRKIAMPSLQAIQKDQLNENQYVENNAAVVQVQQHQQQPQIRQQTTITPISAPTQQVKKPPTKIYKCMSCDFKTVDLKQFQPHYETCKQQSAGYRCKFCKKLFTNMNALKAHTAEKHSNEWICSICSINYQNETAYKKHMETNHPDIKTIETTTTTVATLHNCTMCAYKTTDKQLYEEHVKKHIKVKPFKCRICSMRFETRDQASIHAKTHQPDYFKCGKCSMSFPQRDLLMKHFEIHKPQQQHVAVVNQQQQQQQQHQQKLQQQQQAIQQQQADLTTQKLLQDTIDEALRGDSSGDIDSKINFFSCNICSLTFIQENYYNQHMATHKRDTNNKQQQQLNQQQSAVTTPTSTPNSQSLIRQEVRNTNATILQSTSISDADIESMFEKMHSDKAENEGTNSNSSDNLVITSQEGSGGDISFSITLPQKVEDGGGQPENVLVEINQIKEENRGHVSIDMPVLDQTDEQHHDDQQQQQQQQQLDENQLQQGGDSSGAGGPVSMPSLDDDGDSSQPSNTEQIPMDLEDIQNAGDGQIKFILNEDGQILQLDNHIITTDADGNQILVQGTNSEQIQQLLQSVGVLQAGEGDGETFQMIQGENNQMIIVQGDNNEHQLIDASMLNEDGHLVIQQQEGEEMHVVNEDGVQVPVSIAFAQQHGQQMADGEEEGGNAVGDEEAVQQASEQQQQELLQQQLQEMEDGDGSEQHQLQQQEQQHDDEHDENKQQNAEYSHLEHDEHEEQQHQLQEHHQQNEDGTMTIVTTAGHETSVTNVISSTTAPQPVSSSSSTNEVFFNIDDLMQQPEK